MEAKELTPLQRIEILEDVLQKLEGGDADGGLCIKIKRSAFELLRVWDKEKNIIPLLTLKNAKRVTDVKVGATEGGFWWKKFFPYDFENRIKFVKWMIEQEKSLLNK